MESQAPEGRHKGRSATIATAIAVFTFFDALLIGIPVMLLAAWFNPLIVWGVATGMLIWINAAACGWVDRQWEVWIVGTRFEERLQKMRDSKRAHKPVEWINRGSDAWFGLAAALLNAVEVVTLVRLINGRPVGAHRIMVASFSYSIFVVGIFSLFGFALGDIIRAL